MKKALFIVLGLLVVAALAGFGAMRMTHNPDSGAARLAPVSGSQDEPIRIVGVIEYTVLDADGQTKTHKIIRNTTADGFKNDARARLGTLVTSLVADDLYDNITLCSVAATSTICATGNLSANLDANPADSTEANGATGVYTATKTFTASGASTILALQLTKGVVVNAANTNQSVGAYQSVNVTLASSDTLQITWTVTIS
jgi:hypothetical protein